MKAIAGLITLLFSTIAIAAQSASAERPTTMPAITGLKVEGEQFTCTADGRELTGILVKPPGEGPFPAVIVSHGLGGNARAMLSMRGRDLVRAGYVCIATDYTHAVEQRPQRTANPRERFSGIDFRTVGARPENIRRGFACLEVLRQLPYIDEQRVYAYGHSMGAFVTIALVAAAPDAFRAAAITAGGIVPDGVDAAAPNAAVAQKVRTPVLILHGTADTTVRPEMSLRLEQVLAGNQVPVKRRLFEGAGHNIPTDNAGEVGQLVREWFETYTAVSR